MLPPIEDSVLQSNPKFALLHTSLTKNILSPTGSTKQHPAQKEHATISENLQTSRKRAAKSQLILTALSSLDLSPTSSSTSKRDSKTRDQQTQYKSLPQELIETILLLTARLTNSSLAPSSTKLLESTEHWHALPTHLPAIGALISTYLQSQAVALVRVSSPSTNASFLHRGIPKLVGNIQELQRGNAEQKAATESRRMSLVGKTTILLGLFHLSQALIIRILEQSKHGAVSRHVRTKAEFLSLTAKTVEAESKEKKARAEKLVYSEEVNGALVNYMRCLRDGRERLRERKGDAERVLWGYGVGREDGGEKEKVMRSVAGAYGELVREIKEVGRDVERLRGR